MIARNRTSKLAFLVLLTVPAAFAGGQTLALRILAPARAAVAQEYGFPFKGENLDPGERFFTGDHLPGIQGEGEDIGAMRYLGDRKWTEFREKRSGSANDDFVVYEKRVFAMADGKIVGCWRNAPANPRPGTLHEKFETGTKLVNGKPVPVGLIPGGGNMLFVDNTDGKRVLYAHMKDGTIPASLCSNNATLFPTAMTIPEGDQYVMLPSSAQVPIKKGQFLGNVGNSGSSSKPHLHVHAEQSGAAAVMLFEKGLSKRYVENNTDIRGGWTDFAGREVPDGEVLIRPPRSISYRMADFEAYESGGTMNYVGIFRPGTFGPVALFEDDWNTFLSKWRAIEATGYRMKDFESFPRGQRQMYAGIFAPGSYAPTALFQNDWPAFLDGWRAIETKGYRMKDLEVFQRNGTNMYAGIFEPASYGPMALFRNTWNGFLAGWKDIENKGYRMKDLEIYRDGSSTNYAGVFEPGKHAPMALFKSTWQEFLDGWKAIETKGYRVIDMEVHRSGSRFTFAGIFEPGQYSPAAVFVRGDWDAFTEAWQQLE